MSIKMRFTNSTNKVIEELSSRTMRYSIKEAYDGENKADMVSLELNDNWGNVLYTTRKGMNLLYKAIMKSKNDKTTKFTNLHDMITFIKTTGEEVQVGRYLDKYMVTNIE